MELRSARFGDITINDNSIIQFPGGLPGLEELEQYAIIRCEPTEPIQWLQSIEDTDISIPIINPFVIKKDYEIEVDDSELDYIGTRDEDNLLVMNVMVIPDELEKMTVNLLAPLLINLKNMTGAQVMMDHKEYDISYPAFEALVQFYGEEGEVSADAGAVETSE